MLDLSESNFQLLPDSYPCFPLSIPEISDCQQSIRIYQIASVLKPVKEREATHPFYKGTLVKTGKYFGVVSKINPNSHASIQISWWQPNSDRIEERIWYPWDYLPGCQIEPLALFVPQKTFLTIPANTLVMTNSEVLIQFSHPQLFWLKEVSPDGYHLLNHSELWIFPHDNFPGIPFACVNNLPEHAKLEASVRLTPTDLKIRAYLWLSLNSQPELLMNVIAFSTTETHLIEGFKQSKYLEGEDYLIADLQTAWEQAYFQHFEERKRSEGLYGFKVGTRVVQSIPKSYVKPKKSPYDYLFGFVVDLEPKAEKPALVHWDNVDSPTSYNQEEINLFSICPIEQVKISNQVCYQISTDEKFYRAFVGFSSKKVARSWWRHIKRELGYLSQLVELPPVENPTGCKYNYIATDWQQKTLKARLRHLQIVASWDLTKVKDKPNKI